MVCLARQLTHYNCLKKPFLTKYSMQIAMLEKHIQVSAPRNSKNLKTEHLLISKSVVFFMCNKIELHIIVLGRGLKIKDE